MSTIPELAAQVDAELSKDLPDVDHLLQQITLQVDTPQGCEDLSDLVFDLVPTLIIAAGKSKACENTVEQLLTTAADKCVPREVYSALVAALSESMRHIGIDELCQAKLGASSLEFQKNSLLQNSTHSLLRLKRLSTSFLREHLLLSTTWCQYAQEEEDGQDRVIGEEGFCTAISAIIDAVASRQAENKLTEEERKIARQLLCHSILTVVGSALELPRRLENANDAAQATLLEAQSTLTGKLCRFQSILLELLQDGSARVLSLITTAPEEFGINTLEDLLEVVEFTGEGENNGEALGAAAAVCCSVLRSSSAGTTLNALKCSPSTSKMLRYLSMSLNTLTDSAAQHHSVPLALLPLLVIAQFSRQQEAPLEESYASLTMPIISTLVAVMSLNPVEIVRTCGYEALHTFLDAMVPQARFLVLQNMTSISTSNNTTVTAAVALQRLRLEISPAVLQAPFTHTTALQLALPWIIKSDERPGWKNEGDVLRNVDVLAAALSVLRFVLLQRIALHRNIGKEKEGAKIEIPEALQPEKFKVLVNDHLKPLQACTGNLINRIKIFTAAHQDESNFNAILEINADLELFLALQRLEEVLDRTAEAAKELY